MRKTCKSLYIFEGPDGAGKSTAALKLAKEIGAEYVHFGPIPHIRNGLCRLYVEAMSPALLGDRPVVFDRCWLSEDPYAAVYRQGANRVSAHAKRVLDRLAFRCGGLVVRCLPDYENVVRQNYLQRKELEYLENDGQLKQVYTLYRDGLATTLPTIDFDYTKDGDIAEVVIQEKTWPHFVAARSAGNLQARTLIVGEEFADHAEFDAWYQWPFGSFRQGSSSGYLSVALNQAGIPESELCWINADELPKFQTLYALQFAQVIALGNKAAAQLKHQRNVLSIPHPSYWRRFESGKPYPLVEALNNGR